MNPDTRLPAEEIVGDIPFETLGYYEISYTMHTFDSYIEIMIEVIDPSHYFQIPYYEVYDLSGDFPMWISSEYLSFTPGTNSKTVTMMIQLPDTGEIDIITGIQNQNDFTIKHIVYHETLTKE
jgi:hypothetical protein